MINAMEGGISVGRLRERASQGVPEFTEFPCDNPVIEDIPQENDGARCRTLKGSSFTLNYEKIIALTTLGYNARTSFHIK